MRLLRRVRFKIGRLALILLARQEGGAPIGYYERERMAEQMYRELQKQREALASVSEQIAQFQDEYGRVATLLERAVREFASKKNWADLRAAQTRYADFFAEKDQRLYRRWKEIKHALEHRL